jgi:hypothetical protein
MMTQSWEASRCECVCVSVCECVCVWLCVCVCGWGVCVRGVYLEDRNGDDSTHNS